MSNMRLKLLVSDPQLVTNFVEVPIDSLKVRFISDRWSKCRCHSEKRGCLAREPRLEQIGPHRAVMDQVRYSLGAVATLTLTKGELVLCIKGSPSSVSKQPTHLVGFQEREGTQLKTVKGDTSVIRRDQAL